MAERTGLLGLHRSRSARPRHCGACTTATTPPPSPSLPSRRTSSNPRTLRNSNVPAPIVSVSAPQKSQTISPRPYPSAWALSPGRSPERAMTTMEYPAKAKEKEGGRRRNGVMGFLTRRRTTEVAEREEAAHRARVAACRLMQWRFVNARRERAMRRVRSTAEKKLFFAWLKINELRNIVAAKRILIQRRKHKLRLSRVLNPQVHFLNQWEPLAKRHIESVTGLSKVLEAVCVPIPLVDGAQTNLVLLHSYISMSMEIMVEIEAAVRLFYSKVEEVSTILAQLAETVGLELEGIEELIKTSKKITKLEMHETSLRANLIQAVKKEVEPTPLSTLRLQSWTQSHQWPIY